MPREPSRARSKTPAKPPAAPVAPPDPTNLETAGRRLKVYSLESLFAAKRTFRRVAPAKLGDVLLPWYEKNVEKPAARLGGIVDLWLTHVPEPVARHSRLVSLQRGVLTVTLTHAPVRAQLESLLRQGLLRQLQASTKGAVLRVKTAVDAQPGSGD
jgi:hypothetical protein